MNDIVFNLYPINGNRSVGTMSSGMNRATLNSVDFNSGCRLRVPYVPKLFGAPPNWGGGWASSGILGTYYSNNNYTGTSFQRMDMRIDMPPTTVLPGGSLATDPVYGSVVGATNFSVKWIGDLIPKYTEVYTLKVKTGGTLTLKINSTTIATVTSTDGWVSANYSFTSGTTYSVEIDYVQGTGPWCAQLHWVSAGLISFPEEAIGPATPIGANNPPEQVCSANGGTDATYRNVVNGTAGPALDSSGWPTGDFALQDMVNSNAGNGPYSFPNVGFASDSGTGIWTIQFTGCAGLFSNDVNSGITYFLVGHNDGSHSSVSLNGKTYYKYYPYFNQISTIPVSAMVWDSVTGTGYNPANNTTTVLAHGGYLNVGFIGTDRNGTGAPGGPTGTPHSDGLTNVVCMRPTGIDSTTSYKVGTALNDPYLASMRPYACARANYQAYDIDFVASVSNPYTDWGKRATPVFCANASNTNQYPSGSTSYEFKIMAANQAGKDLYICFPQSASGNILDSDYSSSYLYNLALLIKNGSTFNGVSYPGLLPHLNVYLECGNENWNYSSYSGAGTWTMSMIHAANANRVANTNDWQQYLATDGYTQTDSSGNLTNVHNSTWSALKVKDASDLFRIVFGDSVMPGGLNGYNPDPRIRPIFEWQNGAGFGGYGSPSETLASFKSYFGITINHVFWGGGGACYATYTPAGSDANGVFSNISLATSGLPAPQYGVEANNVQVDINLLAMYGLHHVSYEGGFSFYLGDGSLLNNALQQASNDSRVTPYVAQTMNQYFSSGGSLPVISTATGGAYGFALGLCTIDGMWDEPPYATAPPKLQAYLDVESLLPATISSTPGWPIAPCNFQDFGLKTVNGVTVVSRTFVVQASGMYFVGFTTSTSFNNATSLVTVTLDGTVVGSFQTTQLGGGESFYIPVWMNDGVHSLTVSCGALTPGNGQVGLSPWGVR